METRNFSSAGSCEPATVDNLQKEAIRQAILKSISITPYYDGLELKACKAISAINKFNDSKTILEIIDNDNGDRYQKVST